VLIGVILTFLLYIYQSAEAVRLERILPQENGTFVESEAPVDLPNGEIVILQPIGSLFFAGAMEFEEELPNVGDASGSVVIIRLRDRDEVGSTFIRIIERYAGQLQEHNNKLMLEGLNDRVLEQLDKTDILDLIGKENVFPAHPTFGVAVREALGVAQEWIINQQNKNNPSNSEKNRVD
jgi:SulP family sulfate permease